MKQGSLVKRKSYGGDVLFRIEAIYDKVALLKGVEFRLIADAPLDDLELVLSKNDVNPSTKMARARVAESMHRMKEERNRSMRPNMSSPLK